MRWGGEFTVGLDPEDKPVPRAKGEKPEKTPKGKAAAAKTKPESSQGRRRITQEYTASTISGIAVSWRCYRG